MNTAYNRGRKRKIKGEVMGTTVSVDYSCIDGAHFFTSPDPKWKGLCAASASLKDAFDDVALQLNNLAKYNHNATNPDFQPSSSYEDFLKTLKSALLAEVMKNEPIVAARPVATKRRLMPKAGSKVKSAPKSPVRAIYIPHQSIAWRWTLLRT